MNYFLSFIRLSLLLWFTHPVLAVPVITPKAPHLSAKAWVLMDYQSGQIIASENMDERLAPASLTKMMTSYVLSFEKARGNISSEDQVLISEKAWAKNFPGSSVMFIEVGKKVKLSDLHRGVVIQSGNDASVAIAEHIAGSEEGFADLMNHHAQNMNLAGTHFTNATGLPHPQHYTTARDMAVLARRIISDFPDDYKIYQELDYKFNGIKQFNRNSLLWDKSMDIDGLKTGHTEEAGYCLVTSGIKDNMRLISVVLGTSSKEARKIASKKLLTYGFRFFETAHPHQPGTSIAQQKIWMGEQETVKLGVPEDIYVTIPKGQSNLLKSELKIDKALEAPIAKGAQVGTLYVSMGDEPLAQLPLIALETVEKGGLFSRVSDFLSLKINQMFE